MKNLEKVVKVWTNLESSYTGYKKSHKSVNRADYLKKLLAWDTNGANITGVRNLLHDEIDTYDAKEAATYSELFDELDKTAERLASYSGEIENLDEWVQGVMESDLAKDAVNAVVYTADDFTLLSNHTYAEARDILAAGYFCNTVVMDKNGEIRKYEFNNDDKFYRFFHSKNDAAMFFRNYKESDSKFLESVRDIIAHRIINRLGLDNCAFVSNENFATTSRTATIGNTRIPISKKNQVSSEFKFKGLDGSLHETNVDYFEVEHDGMTLILVRK